MLRKFMLSLALLAAIGFAAAQITVDPVKGEGDPDQISKGATSAEVDQLVHLDLPQATALHLAAPIISFDLTKLDGGDWDDRASSGEMPDGFNLACAYVTGNDVRDQLGDEFWNQEQVVPGGIAYHAATWDQIYLEYFGNGMSGQVPQDARVVNYPPLRLKDDGDLAPGSKDYFVCYQTFVLQLFSNFDTWDLQVSRNDEAAQGIEHLYIQGNTCADFGTPTGLYDLPDGAMRHLIPKTLNVGTTGELAKSLGNQCNDNTSWLDLLGVIAVKINADHHGDSYANLTYTLLSADVD